MGTEAAPGPEPALRNRLKLAYRWIPAATGRLLDAGCNSGYGTHHYARKASEVWGADPDEASIAVARARYPGVGFEHAPLEGLPFADGFFDVVVLTDVLEHVTDEIAAMNEIHRVTRPGGTIIITTPHAGLFGWFDPYNYGACLRARFRPLYAVLRRTGLARATGDAAARHRHYSLGDLERILGASAFGSGYAVTDCFRSGCFLFPLEINVYEALRRVLPERVAGTLAGPLRWLAEMDYWVPCGPAAYNLAVRIRRG
jgi:SAM-dependent methyltransferase